MVIGADEFAAELAVSVVERARGLSGREELAPLTGMLFVYSTSTVPGFWMRGMRFPLDFIWVSEECTVAEITVDVPVPAEDAEELPRYSPAAPIRYNFEVNAGESERYGIVAGAPVRFLGFPERLSHLCR